MPLSRRLTPYLLLGTLTLGAGLGAGLGLSQGPMTYSGARSGEANESTNPYKSSITIRFSGGPMIPTDSVDCVLKGLAEARPMGTAAFKRDVRTMLSKCGRRRSHR